MKVELISEGIYHIRAENRYQLTSTFMRMQEFYESPKFRGKVFGIEEYMDWYASEYGNFTYTSDWSGFNVPGNIVRKFFELFWDDLFEKEHSLYELIEKQVEGKEKFYLIGTFEDGAVVDHELAHAFFYLDPVYKRRATKLVTELGSDFRDVVFKNLVEQGYHEKVFVDEAQAYLSTSSMTENYNDFGDGIPWDNVLKLQLHFQDAKEEKLKTGEDDD